MAAMAARCALGSSLLRPRTAMVDSSSSSSSSSSDGGCAPSLGVRKVTLAVSDHDRIRHGDYCLPPSASSSSSSPVATRSSSSPSASSSSSSFPSFSSSSSSSSSLLHQRARNGGWLRQFRCCSTFWREVGAKRLMMGMNRGRRCGYGGWATKGGAKEEGNNAEQGEDDASISWVGREKGRRGKAERISGRDLVGGGRRRWKSTFPPGSAVSITAKKLESDPQEGGKCPSLKRDGGKCPSFKRDGGKCPSFKRNGGLRSFFSKCAAFGGGKDTNAFGGGKGNNAFGGGKDNNALKLLFTNSFPQRDRKISKVMEGVALDGRGGGEQPCGQVLSWGVSEKDVPRLAFMQMAFVDFSLLVNGLMLVIKSVQLPAVPVWASVWASVRRCSTQQGDEDGVHHSQGDDRWDESKTKRVTMNYVRPVLLWINVIIICRGLDSVSLSSVNAQAVKQRFVDFLRALTTVLAFASVTGSLTQQLHRAWAEGAGEEATKNIGFQFIGNSVSTLVWVAAVFLFMELMGFSTQKWITAGGFGTVVLTLAAREIVTNFLSAIMLHTTRPFKINDWIKTKIDSQEISGVIEHVGWWAPTVVRGDDREAVHIPNHKFSVSVLRNLSQKTHWRVKTKFGISHLDVGKIADIVADMRKIIAKDPQVEQQRLHRRVFFDDVSFENQALMIMVSCFVKTPHYEEFLRVKERLMLDLLRVIKHHNARLATPVRSIQRSFDDVERQPAYRSGPMREEVVRRPILLLDGSIPESESDDDDSRVDGAAEAAAVSVAAVVAEAEDDSSGTAESSPSKESFLEEVSKSDVSPKQPADTTVPSTMKASSKGTEARPKAENGAARSPAMSAEANAKASKPDTGVKPKSSESTKQAVESTGKASKDLGSAEPDELDKKSGTRPEMTEAVGPGAIVSNSLDATMTSQSMTSSETADAVGPGTRNSKSLDARTPPAPSTKPPETATAVGPGARGSKSLDATKPTQGSKSTNPTGSASLDASEQKHPKARPAGNASSDPWADDDGSLMSDSLSDPWASNHENDREVDPWAVDIAGSAAATAAATESQLSPHGSLKHRPDGFSADSTLKHQPDDISAHGNSAARHSNTTSREDKVAAHGDRGQQQGTMPHVTSQKKAEPRAAPAEANPDPLPSFARTDNLKAESPADDDTAYSEGTSAKGGKQGSEKGVREPGSRKDGGPSAKGKSGGEHGSIRKDVGASEKGKTDPAPQGRGSWSPRSLSRDPSLGRVDTTKPNRDCGSDEVTKSVLTASAAAARKPASGTASTSLEPREELLVLSVDNPPFKIPLEESSSIMSSVDGPPVGGLKLDLATGAGAGEGARAAEREVDSSSRGMFIGGTDPREDDLRGMDLRNQSDNDSDR
ncbi:hypothetical protein CBR_g29876 [Chara braunii]|uniref:Mechanosensitive ion channel protein n=1 Tax=Chara braunii TaxID=69332 RepID=A0A388JWW7_CHABU|nr:hypothetical protein CBR_g29876 [Chara braunii]|eukprot:GBG62268.1 hypothetical protein CBR_g29876 [Chara braunii]